MGSGKLNIPNFNKFSSSKRSYHVSLNVNVALDFFPN